MGRKKPTKLLKRQFMFVNPDYRLPVLIVFNQTTKDIATRNPLVSFGSVSNLWLSRWNFHRDMFVTCGHGFAGANPFVEQIKDLLITHGVNLRADSEMRRHNVRLKILNHRVFSVAGDVDFVKCRDIRSFWVHRVSSLARDCSHTLPRWLSSFRPMADLNR